MKRKLIVFMAALLALANTAKADYTPNGADRTDWDFEIYVDGKLVYFAVTDWDNMSVAVKRHPDFDYHGDINVPTQVTVSNSEWIESKHILHPEKLMNKTFTVTEIAKGAFWCNIYYMQGHSNIGTITIPTTVTKIDEYAFAYTTASSIIINSNHVTGISNNAFENCPNLTSVTLPYTITSFGQDAFKDCGKIQRVNYAGSLYNWCCIDFANEAANPLSCSVMTDLYCNNQKIENLVIPDNVNTLKNYTFSGASITSVDLNDVTSIGASCFNGASNLSELTIKKDVTSMGTDAFAGTNITKIKYHIPSTEKITKLPLDLSKITTLTLGTEVTTFKESAFAGFTNLSKVEYLGTTDNWIALDFPNETSKAVTIEDYTLDGTFISKNDMTGVYALAGGMFRRGGASAQPLSPYRIFLNVPSPSNAPVRNRINGEEVTAIEDVIVNGQSFQTANHSTSRAPPWPTATRAS